MSKEHDYSMIDHAIRAAVGAGSNNFTAILTDRMVSLEIDAIHEREMAEWRRKSAMAYQAPPRTGTRFLTVGFKPCAKLGRLFTPMPADGRWQANRRKKSPR